MTQTNDSELEKLKFKANKDTWYTLPNIYLNVEGTDSEGYHYVARQEQIDRLIDQAYSLGIQSGIAKAEKVTRFEVIDHKTTGQGRIVVERDVKAELSYQDDDRTLKVFLTDR